MAYIYKIVNDINQKIYIGKTEFSIEKRFKEHCTDAFREKNEKRPLYAAMRKYGVEHFHIELLEETNNPEEREVYWIEFLRSFKDGYNATLGGDGKRYIDYDLVIATYNKIKDRKLTASILGISVDSVSNILHKNNIPMKSSYQSLKERYQKTVGMFNKDKSLLKVFPSAMDAARFIAENNMSTSKDIKGIHSHIIQVCNKKRNSAYKYYWEYL